MNRLGDTRRTLKHAKSIGCQISIVRNTDEVRVSHPRAPRVIRIKSTRKDTPRCLLTLIRWAEAK